MIPIVVPRESLLVQRGRGNPIGKPTPTNKRLEHNEGEVHKGMNPPTQPEALMIAHVSSPR